MKLKYIQIPLGPLQTNAYILQNDRKECLVFDPGSQGKKLNEWISEQGLTPVAILLTHAHFDHIGAVDEVRDKWNIPVYLHKAENEWLVDPALNGSQFFGQEIAVRRADHLFKGDQKLTVGSFECEIYETPGHSPGSVSFYFENEKVVFSGDALFAGSVGRTDLRGGSHEKLIESIHKKLLVLPEDTVVASGHGPRTTILEEMDRNPFLNGF